MTDLIPYRPGNAFEGADFEAKWCRRCTADGDWIDGNGCGVLSNAFVYEIDHALFPEAWRQDGPSGPRCTAFVPIDPEDQPLDPAAAVRPLL